MVAALKRCKTTPADASLILSTAVTVGGGNPKSVYLSYSHVHRTLTKQSDKLSQTIKQQWKSPSKILVHWDDKTMSSLDGSKKQKRLPVVASGLEQTKMLGAPVLGKITPGTYGRQVTDAVIGLLDEWQCKENVFGMVYDTTSSNTGCNTGACITLQRKLAKPLLWVPCRHHIGEVVVNSVWKKLQIEPSNSPGMKLFECFQTFWNKTPNLSTTQDLRSMKNPPICFQTFYESAISKKFLRDDYLEVVQLGYLFLGKKINGYHIKRPGPINRARWMWLIIYALKIVIISNKDNKSNINKFVSRSQFQKLEKFVKFCVLLYVPWWVSCSST